MNNHTVHQTPIPQVYPQHQIYQQQRQPQQQQHFAHPAHNPQQYANHTPQHSPHPPRPQTPQVQHVVDRTPEYNAFMEKLRAFHAARGTTFDPEPRIGSVYLDMYKIFNHIVANGGYDRVSEEKLAWRRMASELGIFSTNEASTAFSLKEKFYKNLAAFEIKTVHGREPPPKEILEDVSAKGGGLLQRTMANYPRPNRVSSSVDAANLSGDDGTPVRNTTAPIQDSNSSTPSSVRASRGLREAPPPRVIFQPDTTPSRMRHTGPAGNGLHPSAAQQQMGTSPQPAPPTRLVRGASNAYNIHLAVSGKGADSLDPRNSVTLALRPIDTPSNNPTKFPKHNIYRRAPSKVPPPPGTGFEGPNIYLRCLNALRSASKTEQAYAMNHLVKISYERGDKFRFDLFPGLADGLIERALEMSSLFYDVKWTVHWELFADEATASEEGFLDGNNSSRDLLERIQRLRRKPISDITQTGDFMDAMNSYSEAVLTLRNMVTLSENAEFLAAFPPIRDLLCIILNLPACEATVEVKHYALDLAEQLTPYLALDSDDPLYRTLLLLTESSDRGVILSSLRALGRISMNLEIMNLLLEVPTELLDRISKWLLLQDDELLDACLDFLYQYTADAANIESLLKISNPDDLLEHLVRLLSHGSRRVEQEIVIVHSTKTPARDEVPPMPSDLLPHFMGLSEPARAQRYMECFFEEDSESHITQITAWTAYQNAFLSELKERGQSMISPAEFIRNSTTVYKNSVPQILRPTGDAPQKFIIQGIRARLAPITLEGSEYSRCLWNHDKSVDASGQANSQSQQSPATTKPCRQCFLTSESMWEHILQHHLQQTKDENGSFAAHGPLPFQCTWLHCQKYPHPVSLSLATVAAHIATHSTHVTTHAQKTKETAVLAPRSKTGGAARAVPSSTMKSWVVPAKTLPITYEETATVRNESTGPPQAAGIPLSAALILRNIARNIVKTAAEEELLRQHDRRGGEGGGWNERLFRTKLPRLFQVMSENKPLSPYIVSILDLVYPDEEGDNDDEAN